MTIQQKHNYLVESLEDYSFHPITTKSLFEFYYYHDRTIVFDFSDYDIDGSISMQRYLFMKFYSHGLQNGQNKIKDRVNYLLNNDIWLP